MSYVFYKKSLRCERKQTLLKYNNNNPEKAGLSKCWFSFIGNWNQNEFIPYFHALSLVMFIKK